VYRGGTPYILNIGMSQIKVENNWGTIQKVKAGHNVRFAEKTLKRFEGTKM
jgi:hypothetical protein